MKNGKLFLLTLLAVASHVNSKILLPKDAQGQKQRAFSIFSVVQFPNNECVTNSDNNQRGVCMASSDCTSGSGTVDGNCASGFGVCCAHRVSACGSTITQNVTYIQNPGYPNFYTNAGGATVNCAYNIKTAAGICQIRLDFTNHITTGPSATVGNCGTDTLTFSSPTGRLYPTFCGTFSGQHMYIEVGGPAATTTLTESINFGTTTTNRKYLIKVSQIPCSSLDKAPTDCMQYYTGNSGTITSFNLAGGLLLQGQTYASCIRKNVGFCTVQYNQNKDGLAASSFDLLPQPLSFIPAPGNPSITEARNRLCNGGYVYAGASNPAVGNPTQANAVGGSDVYCGRFMNIIYGSMSDSVVKALSTSFYLQTWTSYRNALEGSIGYAIDFNQVPC